MTATKRNQVGPWRAAELYGADPETNWTVRGAPSGIYTDERTARLIAAAPELVEALRALLLRTSDCPDCCGGHARNARALLERVSK